MDFNILDKTPIGRDNKVRHLCSVQNDIKSRILLNQVKVAFNIRPEDDLYVFIYDKDQIFLPPFSRIYGSDFRKLSQVISIERVGV